MLGYILTRSALKTILHLRVESPSTPSLSVTMQFDVDRREYFFGAIDANRVAFTRGRDLVLDPKQKGEPLNYFVYPYAEVDGKPFASIEKSFAYRDGKATVDAAR